METLLLIDTQTNKVVPYGAKDISLWVQTVSSMAVSSEVHTGIFFHGPKCVTNQHGSVASCFDCWMCGLPLPRDVVQPPRSLLSPSRPEQILDNDRRRNRSNNHTTI